MRRLTMGSLFVTLVTRLVNVAAAEPTPRANATEDTSDVTVTTTDYELGGARGGAQSPGRGDTEPTPTPGPTAGEAPAIDSELPDAVQDVVDFVVDVGVGTVIEEGIDHFVPGLGGPAGIVLDLLSPEDTASDDMIDPTNSPEQFTQPAPEPAAPAPTPTPAPGPTPAPAPPPAPAPWGHVERDGFREQSHRAEHDWGSAIGFA